MSNVIEFGSKIAFHPGYYIREYIDELGMTQEEFAMRLGTTPKNVSCIIRGEQSLSLEIAKKLSRLMGTSVKYWLNLQSEFDSLCAEIELEREIKKEIEVFKILDYSYFQRNFKLPSLPRKINEQIAKVREFLGVSSLTNFLKRDLEVNFRTANLEITDANIVKANIMVHIATNMALEMKDTPKYDRKQFLKAIDYALTLTRNYDDFYEVIKEEFYKCGVNLILIPNMSGSKVNGAAKKIGNKMLLMIDDRNCNSDSFWFTLLHEIGHIVKSDYGISYLGDIEDEANKYAEDKLIDPIKYREFVLKRKFDVVSICEFAKQINRDPGIVVGRLQNDNYLKFNDYRYNSLKRNFSTLFNK